MKPKCYTFSMKDIIWSPSEEMIAQSNVRRFMRKHRLSSYEALIAWSVADIGRFWDAVMKDLAIEWETPYQRVYDSSAGAPWTRWFVGGTTNIAANCVDRHVRTHPNAAALIWEGEDRSTRTLTYAELDREIRRLAGALQREGIGPGETVGIYMPMSVEMVAVLYAAFKIGAICIPVFSGFAAGPLSERLGHADAKILFTADGALRRGKTIEIKRSADEAADRLPSLKRVVVLRRMGNKIDWNDARDRWYHDFISQGADDVPTRPVEAETPALILYTSGTTGRPKGTVHTHGGCLAQIGKELAYHFDVKPSDRFFWLTDIGWMMGPWMIIGVHLQGGAVFLYEGAPNHPAPDRLWEMIDRHRITHLGISPTAIRVLIRSGDEWVVRHRLSSLRILGSTGEPWDDESYLWFFEKVGKKKLPIINISGGTEIIGCFLAPLPITPLKPSTLRGPGLGMDVDVFDDDGKPVRGKTGHLVCKQPAPSMTRGFWKDKERYLETYWSRWPNIWFHGDWARIDQDGYWFLHGRSDDTMKIAGKRVGPAEIEAALIGHPSVSEAAAIGVPDPVKGEAIVCFVVLKPNHPPDADALKAEVASAMGKTLQPKEIHFVSDLPKTRSAKIVRRVIRARYLGEPMGDLTSIENPAAIEEVAKQAGES
ncbi:MAG TPA: AMP-binding protein [Candidatus Manganitrophaceae bacterium]|nr:AMP-binding protein [Candidatus Manganitrophaceae bacterium]